VIYFLVALIALMIATVSNDRLLRAYRRRGYGTPSDQLRASVAVVVFWTITGVAICVVAFGGLLTGNTLLGMALLFGHTAWTLARLLRRNRPVRNRYIGTAP